jgi:hypothetical protein
MSTFVGLIVTALVGSTLAVATTVGLVQLKAETPSNTDPVTTRLVEYGQR